MNYIFKSIANDFWYLYGKYIASQIYHCAAAANLFFGKKHAAASLAMHSIRYTNNYRSIKLLKSIALDPSFSPSITNRSSSKEASTRSIIIRWPNIENNRVLSKGVIVITFTGVFSYYLSQINLRIFEKYFILVLEPSWSGYADPDIFGFLHKVDKVIVQSSDLADRIFLNCFPNTFISVSFGASDWVDNTAFKNRNLEKIYDSIYIANTNPIKRIKRYLDAVKNIVADGNSTYKACLVCASWGGAEKLVTQLVEKYNLTKNIDLKFSLTKDEVIRHLNISKTNILLSFKEGSNRSLFESMFCGVPVIALSENIGINKSYINEFTGCLVPDTFLEDTLIWMSQNYSKFKPEEWAKFNITPEASTNKLKTLIDVKMEPDKRNPWYVKTNNPEVSYLDYPNLNHTYYTSELLNYFDINASHHETELITLVSQLHGQFLSEVTTNT